MFQKFVSATYARMLNGVNAAKQEEDSQIYDIEWCVAQHRLLYGLSHVRKRDPPTITETTRFLESLVDGSSDGALRDLQLTVSKVAYARKPTKHLGPVTKRRRFKRHILTEV